MCVCVKDLKVSNLKNDVKLRYVEVPESLNSSETYEYLLEFENLV